MTEIDFYCDHCGCNSTIEWSTIDTLGFIIVCENCECEWSFIAVKCEKHKTMKAKKIDD